MTAAKLQVWRRLKTITKANFITIQIEACQQLEKSVQTEFVRI